MNLYKNDKPRREWDSCDLRYGNDRIGRAVAIEVKASGLGQTWPQTRKSTPRFSIEKQKETWDADTNVWNTCDPPQRTADIYVFCLHEAFPADNDNVVDCSKWQFWVVSTALINERLGDQKTLGRGTLNTLADPVRYDELKTTVDQIMNRGNY